MEKKIDKKWLDKKNKKLLVALKHQNLIPCNTLATPQERGFEFCPCKKKCSLHGECHLCVAYHARKNRLPLCER